MLQSPNANLIKDSHGASELSANGVTEILDG